MSLMVINPDHLLQFIIVKWRGGSGGKLESPSIDWRFHLGGQELLHYVLWEKLGFCEFLSIYHHTPPPPHHHHSLASDVASWCLLSFYWMSSLVIRSLCGGSISLAFSGCTLAYAQNLEIRNGYPKLCFPSRFSYM